MNYLLDTNIISELISKTPNNKVTDFILNLDEKNLYLSVITIGEIKSGIEKLDNGRKKEKLLHWSENDLLVRFHNRIIDIDIEVMLQWGITTTQLKKSFGLVWDLLKTKDENYSILSLFIGLLFQKVLERFALHNHPFSYLIKSSQIVSNRLNFPILGSLKAFILFHSSSRKVQFPHFIWTFAGLESQGASS